MKLRKQKAFTLLEILLVVAIIAVLAGIVILAVNPAKQLGSARNTERRADVATIQRALYQYIIDGNDMPSGLTSSLQDICRSGQTGDCIQLTELTASQRYLAEYPVAPGWTDSVTTGYQIKLSSSGRGVEVTAANAELGETISTPPGILPSGSGSSGGGPTTVFTVTSNGSDTGFDDYAGDYYITAYERYGDYLYTNGTRYWTWDGGMSYFYASISDYDSYSTSYGSIGNNLTSQIGDIVPNAGGGVVGSSAPE